MSLSAGTKLGPYEILALVGKGGMGEVYRAHDPRLTRDVAIKVSAAQFSERFEREAKAIAALNHPNICTLHDIGPNYLVMEFIEGTPLHGPLPLDQALRYAVQICDALDVAHKKNITHRDLKPANILVTASGVKLLDFGLAKIAAGKSGAASATPVPDGATLTMGLTEVGTILGTAAYMSPEQAKGEEADARSDVFSFGLVLYEMLSGRLAFSKNSAIETMAAIVRDEPTPLDAPLKLSAIITRCLRKLPAGRFQTMNEVRTALEQAALEQTTATPAGATPSIAVLPFANMSGDKENEYFSDGLAEEIINALAQVSGLKVTARTSAFAFRGKEQDIRGIAEALNVRTILEGSVRRAGNRIRVTAQLINAEDGYHLWSERYDREMTDVFAMQDEIAAAIAAKLQLKLAASQAVARQYTPSLPAYEALLKGRHHLEKFGPDVARSKEFFDQAIALDPGYVEPYIALARSYISFAITGMRPAREAMPLARSVAGKVLELDPSERRAHALLGSVAALYDWSWKEAQERFRLARVVDPVPFEVRATYAPHYLWPLGRFQEAAAEMERAVEQDPLNFLTRSLLVTFLSELGMHERAMDEARKALEIDENHPTANLAVCVAYLKRGMLPEALASAERAHQLAPWEARVTGILAGLLTITGKNEQAGILIEQLKGAAPWGMVLYHCICSEIDAAADWYQKAIEQREPNAVVMANSSLTKPLRDSPRWPALAKMMNLPGTT